VSSSYVYSAVRTPFGKFNGALAEVRPDDLAAGVVKAAMAITPDLDPSAIGDVVWGNANGAGEDNRNVGRMAVLLAGLPVDVPATTLNRLCGSSLDAVLCGSRAIETGDAEVVLTGGVE
jgi:acetyl-CoA acyltransferase